MSLVSASELAALRDVAQLGMQTEVMVLTRTTVQNDDGQGDFWPNTGPTYLGWLYSEPTPQITLNAGEQVTVNTYRLFFPVGTAIAPGDHCLIEGSYFTVSDTNAESTWLPLLRCSLRRLE